MVERKREEARHISMLSVLALIFCFFSPLLAKPLGLAIVEPQDKTGKVPQTMLKEYQKALKVEAATSSVFKEEAKAPYTLKSTFTKYDQKKGKERWRVKTRLELNGKKIAETSVYKELKVKKKSKSFVQGSLHELARESFGHIETMLGVEGSVVSVSKGKVMVDILSSQSLPKGSKVVFLRKGKIVGRGKVVKRSMSTLEIRVTSGKVRIDDEIKGSSVPTLKKSRPKKKKSSFLSKALITVGTAGIAFLILRKRSKSSTSSATTTTATSKAKSIQLTANPTSVPADGSSIAVITALVKDENNVAVDDATPVVFTTDAGTIVITGGTSSASTVSGVAMANLVAPTSASTATVTAVSGTATSTTSVTFTAVTAPPSSIDLTAAADPISIASSGTNIGRAVTTITATVKDSGGNTVADGTTVTFTTDLGTVTGTASTTSGVATTTFSSSATGTATVTAKAGSVTQTLTLTIQPGPPHAITVEANPQVIEADGNSFSTITATVRDISGNIVTDGTQVDFSVTADKDGGGNGDITSSSFTLSGIATAILISRVPGTTSTAAGSGTATIVATVPTTQPTGIPAPSAAMSNSKTKVTFASRVASDLNFTASTINLRGLDVLDNTSTITALVFDNKGNPVPDGTTVFFSVSGDTKIGVIEGDGPTINGVAESKTVSGKATATFSTNACALFDGLTIIGSNLTSDAAPVAGVCDSDGAGAFNAGEVFINVVSGAVSRENFVLTVTGPAYLQPGTNNFTTLSSPMGTDATGGSSPANRFVLGTCKDKVTITVNGRDINNHPVADGLPVKFTVTRAELTADMQFTGGIATAEIKTATDCATGSTAPGDGQLTAEILNTPGSNITLTFYFKVQ